MSTMAAAMPDSTPEAGAPVDPAAAWKATEGRDVRFDGAFVYAVRTTGVYCRPICPSRRPLRRHVTFFRSPEEAERAGFRACLRCRPRSASGTAIEESVRWARAYIDAHLDQPASLAMLAKRVGFSPYHLQRAFQRAVGLSPRAYRDARRLERFKAHLRDGDTVGEATYQAGFGSSRGLYEGARQGLGMTPGVYRQGGRGLRIRYGTVRTSLGRLLVGATHRGVCAVALGDDERSLEAELAREFPAAACERDDPGVRGWVEEIVRRLEGEAPRLAVPVDLRGTDFQRRVWRALRAIPYGETRSYGEVAAALGAQRSTRAVARACASNRAAIVVPCHRVVSRGGAVGGYRWGVERKRRLLARERRGRFRRPGSPAGTSRSSPSPPRRR